MATFQKFILSGSTDGRPIKITTNASPGTLVHTASATSGVIDEIWLWATNTDSVSRLLTLLWGGVTSPDDRLTSAFSIDPNSDAYPISPGLILQNGLIARVYGDAANIFNITGYVNRITP